MNDYIQTIPGWDYSTVHKRCFENDGCIVDLGCRNWDWSKIFIGKKRVIGVDPFEQIISDTEFFKGIIGNYDGIVQILNNDVGTTSQYNPLGEIVEVKTWKTFISIYNIDKISVLKLNVEGDEYHILDSFLDNHFENIDQIVVSFHEKYIEYLKGRTEKTIRLLKSKNYNLLKINDEWDWYLAVKNI